MWGWDFVVGIMRLNVTHAEVVREDEDDVWKSCCRCCLDSKDSRYDEAPRDGVCEHAIKLLECRSAWQLEREKRESHAKARRREGAKKM